MFLRERKGKQRDKKRKEKEKREKQKPERVYFKINVFMT